MQDIPLIQRREVEARVLAPIIKDLAGQFGQDAVHRVVSETIERLAREHGAQLATSMGSNSMEDLPGVLKVWKEGGALEIDMLRADKDHFDFDVTRCRFAEMYHELGIPELGPILSCNRDFCFAQGFNPDFELQREQTLMEGHTCCNFRFSKKTASSE